MLVGVECGTVEQRAQAIVARGSNFSNHSILLPLRSAPWMATNRPCTWKIGKAWISTSLRAQPQYSFNVSAFDDRLPCVSIAPLLRPVVPLV